MAKANLAYHKRDPYNGCCAVDKAFGVAEPLLHLEDYPWTELL